MVDRKKRVKRLKKISKTVILMLLILPSVFCGILAVKVGKLEREIDKLKSEEHRNLEIVWSDDAELTKTEEKQEQEPVKEESFVEEKVPLEDEILLEEENLRKVYLTFDDGPSMYTQDILEVLKIYDVKATFFVTGMKPEYGERLQDILDDGHSLALHSFSHVYSDIYSSLDNFKNDFNKLREYVYQNTGEEINLFRFPGGSANNIVSPEVRKEILTWLEKEGIVYFDWNVSSGDGGNQILSPQEIADNCIKGISDCNTAIVLLHDSSSKVTTIEALPLIIEAVNEMENTVLLPMDEETTAIQQIRLREE